jgi:transcriptional regulator with XRE-family HTH domain
MGRPPRALTPEASARDRFGAELRRCRTARGLTQRELATLIWHSQEFVSKVEKGERWATWYLATRCDAALRTGGALAGLWPAVERQHLASDRRRRPMPAPRAGTS